MQSDHDDADRGAQRGAMASAAGAIAGAFAAAACCVGPLVVAALGVGGAGAMVALAPYRPYFSVATVLMLGVGFFLVYRRRPASGRSADACVCDAPAPKRRRDVAKVLLWVATAAALLLGAAPYVVGASAASAVDGPRDDGGLTHVEIPVQGMDCASCGVAIRRAMDGVDTGYRGFELDLERQTVSFRHAGDDGDTARFADAIRALGYPVGAPRVLARPRGPSERGGTRS